MSQLTENSIDIESAINKVRTSSAGAILTFNGVVRDHNTLRNVPDAASRDVSQTRGAVSQTRIKKVSAIEYHAYKPMAIKEMDIIEEKVRKNWRSILIHLVHRVGLLKIGETSVVIAVSSPHRAEGFEALRFAIEEIKRSVPIWKKEIYPDGYTWIEGS